MLATETRETVGRLVRRLRNVPGLPLAQITVLSMLDREGPKGISDLAAGERVRPQSMAQTVRELETAGLVSRRPDPDDRRRFFVEPTTAGLASLQASRASREDWLTRALSDELDAEERELFARALVLMRRIADA
jgi:DNA-binding MarR family transcriptional regulator